MILFIDLFIFPMLRFLLKVVDFYVSRITVDFSDRRILRGTEWPFPGLSSPLVLRPIDLLTGLSTYND